MAGIFDFRGPRGPRSWGSVREYQDYLEDALEDPVVQHPNKGKGGKGGKKPDKSGRLAPDPVQLDSYRPLDPPADESGDDDPEADEDGGALLTSRRPGRRPAPTEDCAWCTYGKPAAIGAAAGAVIGYLSGWDLARTALWGAGGGLGYGFLFGDPFPSAPTGRSRGRGKR